MTTKQAARLANRGIPVRLNLGLAGLLIGIGLGSVLLLPWLVATNPAWGLLLALFVVTTPTLWVLIHEAIHHSLHPSRRTNDAFGRVLAIAFGAPFHVLRFGHIEHHRAYVLPDTRTGASRPRFVAVSFHYARIMGGLYLAEVATLVAVWLPRRALRWVARQAVSRYADRAGEHLERLDRTLLAPAGLARFRLDSLLILVLFGAGFWLYGADAWMLLAALLGRAVLVSFMDNIYHHRPVGVPRRTLNLRLPAWASAGILHANRHAVHHRDPGLPWIALPHAEDPSRPDFDRAFFEAALEQLLKPSA
ncbi:fatty acid desaturase [Thioalkalicoccus limnaeus]|uniref:Fatty acid desaturase n=1 Tax=Thioalkalicoccus limnaeus TaxID=120681 RepID=A0ABV4BBD0_9GAMM